MGKPVVERPQLLGLQTSLQAPQMEEFVAGTSLVGHWARGHHGAENCTESAGCSHQYSWALPIPAGAPRNIYSWEEALLGAGVLHFQVQVEPAEPGFYPYCSLLELGTP